MMQRRICLASKKVLAMCVLGILCLGLVTLSGCSLHDGGGSSARGKTAPGGGGKKQRGTKPYTIKGKTYYPLVSVNGFTENGIASWYGKDFHGKLTANGERYNMYGMTAAHKILPFGTQVRVTNKNNGKSIVVRINDRGPFVSNRIIDLTKTGAEKLGMIAAGTAPVRLETLGSVKGLKDGQLSGKFYVQVGAFANKSNAENLKSKIQKEGKSARVVYAQDAKLWRVQVGPYPTLKKMQGASDQLDGEFDHNFIIAE